MNPSASAGFTSAHPLPPAKMLSTSVPLRRVLAHSDPKSAFQIQLDRQRALRASIQSSLPTQAATKRQTEQINHNLLTRLRICGVGTQMINSAGMKKDGRLRLLSMSPTWEQHMAGRLPNLPSRPLIAIPARRTQGQLARTLPRTLIAWARPRSRVVARSTCEIIAWTHWRTKHFGIDMQFAGN